jgi:hypothetical protein
LQSTADSGDVSISNAEKIYSQSEATNDINQFMCNSLHLASDYKSVRKTRYRGKPRHTLRYDPLYPDKIRIIHAKEECTGRSDVHSATSFVRYIQVGASRPRLCDYSSKYSQQYFKDFIDKHSPFIWQECFQMDGDSQNTQALVLLKKGNKPSVICPQENAIELLKFALSVNQPDITTELTGLCTLCQENPTNTALFEAIVRICSKVPNEVRRIEKAKLQEIIRQFTKK